MKRETLEEAAECKSHHSEEDFIRGAKWQAERSYSEEEVRKLFNQYKEYFSIYRNSQILNVEFDEWFEENKKK